MYLLQLGQSLIQTRQFDIVATSYDLKITSVFGSIGRSGGVVVSLTIRKIPRTMALSNFGYLWRILTAGREVIL